MHIESNDRGVWKAKTSEDRTIKGINAKQTEADHPAETGDAVDAVHEIIESSPSRS